jgi:hypothetical protein
LKDNPDDEIETDLLGKGGQTILALTAPQVCVQSLPGSARDCWEGPQAMSDERSPGRIALSLIDEGRAASGDSLDRVGERGSICTRDFVENLRQFRGDGVPQILQATEVGIEGAFRRPRLPRYVFDGDGGDRPARQEDAGRFDELRSGPGAPLPADLRAPIEVDLVQSLPFLIQTKNSY